MLKRKYYLQKKLNRSVVIVIGTTQYLVFDFLRNNLRGRRYAYIKTIILYVVFKNKEKLSKAHKKHFYQRIHQSGWSHLKITNYLKNSPTALKAPASLVNSHNDYKLL